MTDPDPVNRNKEIAKLMAGKLIERRDVKAIQAANGAYRPVLENGVHSPFTLPDLIDHLEGRRTYGHYVLSQEGTCRMACFDIDLNKGRVLEPPFPDSNPPIWYHYGHEDQQEIWPREVWHGPTTPIKRHLATSLRFIAQSLAERTHNLYGLQTLVAYSGSKGMHVLVLLDRGTQASEARELGVEVLGSFDGLFIPDRGKNFFRHKDPYAFGEISIEIFPKQDKVRAGDGLGNLVRLPLGVNQKSKKPGFFLDLNLPMNKIAADDALTALTEGSVR